MKKIAYIYDGHQMYSNSVSDIQYNLSQQFATSEYEQIIISARGKLTRPITTGTFNGLKTYSSMRCSLKEVLQNKDLSVLKKMYSTLNSVIYSIVTKIPRVQHIYRNREYNRYYKKIFQLEKPNVVVYFSLTPQTGFSKTCKKLKIPYISVLYDTFVSNPGITQRDRVIENEEIANAVAYFVPSFFMRDYKEYYRHANIHPFNLPLLITQDKCIKAYANIQKPLRFTYFGLLQSFRNADRIKGIFQEIGETLDIFSPENNNSDETYVFHKPLQQEALYEAVASSKFLVAFDNSEPYAHYLPSKVYLYVSFTKPIIVFGNNKDSALKQFLNGYPNYYYHHIENPSLEGLREFIKKNQISLGFHEEIYARYTQYLPQMALRNIVMTIKNC